MVYPNDVPLGFNDTPTERGGWCPPKSAVAGFHADNDIDTLNLLAERGRVNYKVRVRVGTRKRFKQNRSVCLTVAGLEDYSHKAL